MAIKNNRGSGNFPKVPEEALSPVPTESVYSQEQLVAAYKSFGAAKELVIVALGCSGKKEFTRREAAELITKFKNLEVGKQ